MHIVHVITRLLRAGSEENTLETCRWQAAQGHRVTLLHGAEWDPYWAKMMPEGVTRIAVPEMVHAVRPAQDAAGVQALRALYRRLAPDVIHTHQSKAGIVGRLAARAAPRALVVHGIHILPFEGVGAAKRMLYVAAEKAVAARTDVFIGVSEAVGAAYVNAGIAPRERVHCVRSGMDLERFRAADRPSDWSELLGACPSVRRPRVVLMMAAFEPRKRHIAFLRAFAQASGQHPDIRILLAGRGPEEAAVRAEIIALGLADRVTLCGHRPDPEALFALADLSVLTSAREGLPRVAVQSVAAGCPMLVQALPGLSEVIEHGRNGWIADPDDMDGFVRQMCEILNDAALLDRLRLGARRSDLSAWALDALGVRTTALYQRAIAQKAARIRQLEAV